MKAVFLKIRGMLKAESHGQVSIRNTVKTLWEPDFFLAGLARVFIIMKTTTSQMFGNTVSHWIADSWNLLQKLSDKKASSI